MAVFLVVSLQIKVKKGARKDHTHVGGSVLAHWSNADCDLVIFPKTRFLARVPEDTSAIFRCFGQVRAGIPC